jgi:hypothetical protein
MKVSNSLWAEQLAGKIPESLAREIDIFETEVAVRKQGKIDERLFAETRLRRGIYGQRYDNGQRHNGKEVQELVYPSGTLTNNLRLLRSWPRSTPTASGTSPPGRTSNFTMSTSKTLPV